ncbi:hypothetical protein DFH07DRAFT_771797 [Mycena maculata]|uniref:Uncharacterized protein n=1 Tax=Mycena maculata TaxID=230809 RepID=A0AAD7JC38_9AGAR|nr:hypothetical protein DFH07DRAFT_771797 [Mycena maculata]
MAPGANYMGGKRNAARTRSKDTTGRVHKTHFGRQRLEILSKGLGGRGTSGGTPSGYGPRITASDIALSHAKHLEEEEEANIILATVPTPHRKLPATSHKRSSSGSRSSRVLETLDTTEPLAMRAALDKILSLPDLAGLYTRRISLPKRSRAPESDLPYPQRKRQGRLTFFPGKTWALTSVIEKRQNPTRLTFKPESEDQYSEEEYEPSFYQPESPPNANVANKENSPPAQQLSAPRNFDLPAVSLSAHPTQLTPPSERTDSGLRLRDNLYEYQDPWNAIGVILGLEGKGSLYSTASTAVSQHNSHITDPHNMSSPFIDANDGPQTAHFHKATPGVDGSIAAEVLSNESNLVSPSLSTNHSRGASSNRCVYNVRHYTTPATPPSRLNLNSHDSDAHHISSGNPDESLIDEIDRIQSEHPPAVDDNLKVKFPTNSSSERIANSASPLLFTNHSSGSSSNPRARRNTDDVSYSPTPITPNPHNSDAHNITSDHQPSIDTHASPHLDRDTTPAVDNSLKLKFPLHSMAPLLPPKTERFRSLNIFNLRKGGATSVVLQTPPSIALRPAQRSSSPAPTHLSPPAPARYSSPGQRFPRFTKLPLPLEPKRQAPIGIPFNPSPRDYSQPLLPTSSPLLQSFTSFAWRSREVESTEVDYTRHRRVNSPEVGTATVADIGQAEQAGDAADDTDNPPPGKFFGDLCLFSDDIVAPDSDD